jgi:Tol biopolymer transport system component
MRHGRCSWRVVVAVITCLPLAVLACGQGEDLAGPAAASLRVTTSTSGTGTDADGYTVAIDGRLPQPVGVLDTLVAAGIAPGEHTVDLDGIAAACAVEGGGSRTVTASQGTVAAVDFGITCTVAEPLPTGALRVTVTTTGVDPDPDGYVVMTDPAETKTVPPSGEVLFEALPVGPRSVRLSALAANCSVQGPNPQSVELLPEQEASLGFQVRCWPPPGGRIAYVEEINSRQIVTKGPDGSELDREFFSVEPSAPSWSPNGRYIAFSDQGTTVWDLQTDNSLIIDGCGPTSVRPAWSPNSARLLCIFGAAVETSLWSVLTDGSQFRLLSEEGQEVTGAWFLDDGNVLYTARESGVQRVYRVAGNGGTLTRLFDIPSDVILADRAFVPTGDGSKIAYIRDRGSIGNQLYIADGDGSNVRLVSADLTVHPFLTPAWSPDGSMLVFAAEDHIGEALWVFPPDGSAPVRLGLPEALPSTGLLDWSPDGTHLVFALQRGFGDERSRSLYIMRVDGSAVQQLTTFRGENETPVWAP